jgi:hypothetical protein
MIDNSLQPYRQLAQDITRASASKDFALLGRLLSDWLNPNNIDVLIYVRSTVGNLTIVGNVVDYWSRSTEPTTLAREPSLEEFALVLQAATWEV